MKSIDYTKIFLKEKDIGINDITVKKYSALWWKNIRTKETGGLRLTETGYNSIKEIIRFYHVPFIAELKLTMQTLVFFDRYMDKPYYLTATGIYVTDQKKAVELTMYAGDIDYYGRLITDKMQSFINSNS